MSVKTLISKVFLTLLVTTLAVFASPASAQTIYGASNGMVQGQGPSDFYLVDAATGVANMVGPIGFTNVTGMACLPDGTLVASVNADNVVPAGPAGGLIEIDPTTGTGTYIGTIGDFNAGTCGRYPDITWDDTSGTLFGYGDFCNGDPEGLFTIDPVTGAGSSVGASGFTGGGNGMAAEPGTGTLYATPFDNGSLVTLDPVTGAGTEVPGSATNVPFRIAALAFDPASGALYGAWNDGTGSSLVTIDTSNGVTTTVAPTIAGLDAMVFACGDVEPAEFARFRVTKDFDDDNEAEVPITISCNTGLPLEQHWDLSEDNPVNFVVGDFEQGALNCEITEDDGFPGYTASYNTGEGPADSCAYTDLVGSQYFCTITNTLNPSDVNVAKSWIDENPEFNPINYAEAEWSCSNVASGNDGGMLEFLGNPGTDSFSVFPDWENGTVCTVDELVLQDGGVEIDDSDCASVVLFPGDTGSCTIYNTRLYEGIPTLSQYGLAILAFMMLGLGFVAFRRYG